MEELSQDEAEKLKTILGDDYNAKTAWSSARVDYKAHLTFPWPFDRDEYNDRVERTGEFLDKNFGQFFLVAYEGEQYLPEAERFIKEYGSTLELDGNDLPDCLALNEFMIVPKDLEWCIVIDHEGRIGFNGSEDFISEVK